MQEIHAQPMCYAIWLEEEQAWFYGTLKEIFKKLETLKSNQENFQ